MKERLTSIEAKQEALAMRLDGLEHTVEESVVQLVGALVAHLSKAGRLDLKAFEDDLRDDFNPDLKTEDATGLLFSGLAELVSFYRHDSRGGGRCEFVYEMLPARVIADLAQRQPPPSAANREGDPTRGGETP